MLTVFLYLISKTSKVYRKKQSCQTTQLVGFFLQICREGSLQMMSAFLVQTRNTFGKEKVKMLHYEQVVEGFRSDSSPPVFGSYN